MAAALRQLIVIVEVLPVLDVGSGVTLPIEATEPAWA